MILNEHINPDILLGYGFKKEVRTSFDGRINMYYKYYKQTRKVPSLIIRYDQNGREPAVVESHNYNNDYWEDLPDVLYRLIQNNIIVINEEDMEEELNG